MSHTPAVKSELVDELMKSLKSPEDAFGPDGLFNRLKGALMERMLEAEMASHLGYEHGTRRPEGAENARNGHGSKTAGCPSFLTFLFSASTSSSGTCCPGLKLVSPPFLSRTYSITRPSTTRRYGDSIKPNSLIRAKHESDEINPMFGPSGVSIGQMRP